MQMSVILLETTLLVATTLAASFDLCSECTCTEDTASPPSRLIDCSKLYLADLPQSASFLAEPRTTVLDFETNNIRTIRQFPRLDSVTWLRLRHNAITEIAESAFANLDGLRTLDLSHNELTGDEIRADVFRGRFGSRRYEPLGVRVLNIGYNRISSLGGRAFEHLEDLDVLYLDGNPLGFIDSATEMALSWPSALKVLDLGNTGISELPDTLLHSLKDLKELYLNGNKFQKVPESLAALGRSLEKLNLNDNKLTSLDENSFLGLSRLNQLNVSGCSELTEVLPATFSHLTSLRSLYLSYNFKLNFVSPDAFRELRDNWPIRKLFLHQNALTSLPKTLAPWEKLEVLDIQENPWRCDCELEWLVEELVPRIRRDEPDLVTDIRCDKPRPLRGEQLMTLNTSLLCDVTTRMRQGVHLHPLTLALVMLSLLVGVVVMVTVCRRFWVRRGRLVVLREVRYKRQLNELEDDDYS